MILVCKNVYKVLIFLKMFSSLKDVFESVGVCFENSKDVFGLKMRKKLGTFYLLKSLSCLFTLSFDIVILPFIGKKPYLWM